VLVDSTRLFEFVEGYVIGSLIIDEHVCEAS
jgi:hypothetical protein